MTTMNISLADELSELVNQQVAEATCTSPGDYRRQFIREHRELLVRFRKLIDEGASSPLEGTFDKGYFDDLRARARPTTRVS